MADPRRGGAADRWSGADSSAVAAALALIAVSAVVGRVLKGRGVGLLLPSPPLLAHWHPHLGWGTPLAVLCMVAGLRLQRVQQGLAWTRLLLAGWLLNLAWMCSLTLVDGLRRAVEVLLDPNEYLHDLPRITGAATFLSTFTHDIAFGPGVDGTTVWTTHVAGHPPLATLVFWLLARVGLGGGFWAGALCILVGSAASVALPVTLRELGAAAAARRCVPFVALFPGAVWMAVSADGLFAGVAVSGLALVSAGAARRRPGVSLAGGLLLGATVFLSYGLVLFGLCCLVPVVLTAHRQGLRRIAPLWTVAAVGFLLVAVGHLVLGFDWFAGLARLRVRYYQGVASQRPFSYFGYANLAAWLVSCSPLLAVGVTRSVIALGPGRRGSDGPERAVALLALSAVLAALVADLSALSKAETERIWLSFGVVAYAGTALLRGRVAAWSLLASAGSALLVNSLYDTGW